MMIPDLDVLLLKSFVAVVDTKSLTVAGRRIGRTQSAVSQQIQRLEHAVGKQLIRRDRRRLVLTQSGELLLQYARAILRLNDEARARLSAPELEGRVRFGTPDLYAAYLLPSVLANFARTYPRIDIELRCALSVSLHAALARGELDLALVTGRPSDTGGQFVRREPLVWVAAPDAHPEDNEEVPLAMLPPGALYRDLALEALGDNRRWRIVCVSESIAGLQAAVFAGLAVSVVARSAVVSGMRVLSPAENMPPLPKVDLMLHRGMGSNLPAASRLADYVVEQIGQDRETSRAGR
jgi:DNA-binding transcriptional LysR family regulator